MTHLVKLRAMPPESDVAWHEIDRDGTHLVCADFGGAGHGVLLLHGLAGHATEWSQTASWLTHGHHVVAPDARGHGRSARAPRDVSRDAHVADVAAWIEHIGNGPVSLVGQSLGGLTAILVAARHPDLVDRLVVVEATPGPADEQSTSADAGETVNSVRRWLESWPVPFASREAAVAFFGRNDNWARAWADGLEEREGGLYPAFDSDVMVETLNVAGGSYWEEWRSITCPVLVVFAEERDDSEAAHRMVREQRNASLVEIPDAGHDLHLDNPSAWRAALVGFLEAARRSVVTDRGAHSSWRGR